MASTNYTATDLILDRICYILEKGGHGDYAKALREIELQPHGPNGKTWTDGDFLDQALTNATGSILSQYAADMIRKRAIELRLSATDDRDSIAEEGFRRMVEDK